MNERDAQLLEEVLERDDLSDGARKAFEDMQQRGFALKPKQRAWLEAALEGKRYEPEPEYENLVSRGLVPMGRPVETPAVLRKLPKRPPIRRVVVE